jgi:hypothetical protein
MRPDRCGTLFSQRPPRSIHLQDPPLSTIGVPALGAAFSNAVTLVGEFNQR